MGRKNSGGWLILGLIGLGLFKCGDTTKNPTTPMAAYSPVPAVSHVAPVQTAYSPPPAQPPTTPRSLFAEPTTNGYRGEPAAEATPIRRSLYVRGKEVPMRSAPDAKARILNRLPNGMEVGELSRREGWVQVRHPISAAEGWISVRRLSEVRPQSDHEKTEEQQQQSKPKKTERPGLEVLSDVAIIARLIALDAASYSGNCRCPENTDRAGRRCGARSAYSKPGGWAPLCYAHDVKPAMIANFRANQSR